LSGTGQEEGPEGVVVRSLSDLEEVVQHRLGQEEEAAVIEDREEVEVRPFLDEEGEQRQKPGRR
jgi:hypothetical protein